MNGNGTDKTTGTDAELVMASIIKYRSALLLDGRLDEPMRVQLKPGFDTACWSWNEGIHRVFVGDRLLERRKDTLDRAQQMAYVGSYMHHERSHALYTQRDPAATKRALDSHGVPFGMYNLVEDARCEHRYRIEAADEFKFGWLEYENAPTPAMTGTDMESMLAWWAFFSFIQAEGDTSTVFGEAAPDAPDAPTPVKIAREAHAFYEEAIQAGDSIEAIEVAARMLKRFPGLAALGSRCGLAIGMSMSGEAGSSDLESFAQDARDDMGGGKVDAEKEWTHGLHSKGKDEEEQSPEIGSSLLSEAPCVQIDSARVTRLANKLASLKGGMRQHKEYSTSPRKRVSMRHALSAQARWVERAECKGWDRAQNVLLVLDVSGSMHGSPQSAAAHLVAGLSRCASLGLIRGDVVLSTTDARGHSKWMRKALPWLDADASRIRTHDAEGLARTLRDHDMLVQTADAVFVFTDGHIGGARINHEAYARRGKRVTGLYCNSDDAPLDEIREQMTKHFSRIVVRDSIEALADALVSAQA